MQKQCFQDRINKKENVRLIFPIPTFHLEIRSAADLYPTQCRFTMLSSFRKDCFRKLKFSLYELYNKKALTDNIQYIISFRYLPNDFSDQLL